MKWADAMEPPVPLKMDDDEDWTGGWEALKPTTISPTPPTLQKPSPTFGSPMVAIDPPPKRVVPEKKTTGGLKLAPSKPKAAAVDDIDSLLGIKPTSGTGSPSMTGRLERE
ncbi:hypothetical protein COOONC_27009 [Cooperia oncophora]